MSAPLDYACATIARAMACAAAVSSCKARDDTSMVMSAAGPWTSLHGSMRVPLTVGTSVRPR